MNDEEEKKEEAYPHTRSLNTDSWPLLTLAKLDTIHMKPPPLAAELAISKSVVLKVAGFLNLTKDNGFVVSSFAQPPRKAKGKKEEEKREVRKRILRQFGESNPPLLARKR